MKTVKYFAVGLCSLLSLSACALPQQQPIPFFAAPLQPQGSPAQLFQLQQAGIPDFGAIPAPSDNPVTQGKVELGFRLWFEPRLSANNRMTCATCHHHMRGFSNSERNAMGVTGQRGRRNVPTIYGSVFQRETFWDGRSGSLDAQALDPVTDPIEMNETLPNVLRKLSQVPYYQHKFQEVFGTPPTAEGMAKALASFERALIMAPTPLERYQQGDATALSPSQIRGMELFFSPRTRCSECHQGPAFSDQLFHNLGVGFDRPNPDLGRFEVTRMEWDRGAFKTPTLLNIARTAPYMHDGSLDTLADVLEFYDEGGIPNPQQDPRIQPLQLTEQEEADLLAFLHSLSAPDNLKALGRLPGIRLPQAEIDLLLAGR